MGPRTDLVRDYFERCNSGTAAQLAAAFTDDAVVYDTNVAPVRGPDAIGAWWVKVRDHWGGARWVVDAAVEQGDAVAVEWTMSGESAAGPFTVRGSDHYDFRGDRICQIRQYWTFDRDAPGSELRGFPYGEDPRFTSAP